MIQDLVLEYDIQQWALDNDTEGWFHLPYNPQATGLIERKNGFAETTDTTVIRKRLLGRVNAGTGVGLNPP